MRLEQRRVLNADFQFMAGDSLALSDVSADLTVRETIGGNIEFELSSGIWTAEVGSDPVSGVGTPILSLSVASFDSLDTALITAQNATRDVVLDASARDLNLNAGLLTIQGFGNVSLVGGANEPEADFQTENLSVVAQDEVVFSGTVEVLGTIDITATGGLGNVRFSEALTVTAGDLLINASFETGLDGEANIDGDIDINTATFDLNADINTTSGGTVTVTNSDVVEFGFELKITAEGTVRFDGTGRISLNSDIETTGSGSDIIVEQSLITAAGDRSLTTNDGEISFD
jgi:hypothetical protein